jgi:putative glutamine amidotransferase
MSAPLIGVTGVARTVEGYERTGVNSAYISSVLQAGGLPLILSPLISLDMIAAMVDRLDGVLLTGGEDLAPATYGAGAHPALGVTDPRRDTLELAVVRAARTRSIPLLGICRGLEVLNVALGGTLWQDLPSERPDSLPHNQVSGRTARTHPVSVTPGSRLAAAVGGGRLEVNSFHHQAIRTLAPALVATATALDGIIEGVETVDGGWLLAVQWHPEEFYADPAAPDRGLFTALVAAAGAEAVSAAGRRERGAARSTR